MIAAADMQAMRRALEALERLDTRPREIRPFFAPKAWTIRLAAEIAIAGGIAYLPKHPSNAWFDLYSSGWVIGILRHGAAMELDEALMSEFQRQRQTTREASAR